MALLVAGFDEYGPSLYHTDPSGPFVRYEAKAIGAGSEGAQTQLQEAYSKSMTLAEAETLALNTLKQVRSLDTLRWAFRILLALQACIKRASIKQVRLECACT